MTNSARIITVDGNDAGVLVVNYRTNEIYLGRIELHPDHQGEGSAATSSGNFYTKQQSGTYPWYSMF
ncbi:hypothetical protein [Nocardia sp. GAS34]|uniref:hypothetical protein n=1 Tax=unclassified Nocardia TaxID=2637762 RepID=UPI003D231E2D